MGFKPPKTKRDIDRLVNIVRNSKNEQKRVDAAKAILDEVLPDLPPKIIKKSK